VAAAVISLRLADRPARLRLAPRPRGHADARAGDRRTIAKWIEASGPVVGRTRPGQAVIELALFLGFFLALSLGVIEFGRAFQAQIVVVQAAREGARLGADPTTTIAQIQAAATEAALPYPLTNVDVQFPAGQVQVTPTYRFTTMLAPLWFIDDMDIRATVVARRV
jgi:Flp pilus assembly protein TadG